MRRPALVAAALIAAAVSVGDGTAAATPAAVVRAWSKALNANDNAAAARLFAPGARVTQPGVDAVLRSRARALAFNESLPCARRIASIRVVGIRATTVFVLGERPKHHCDTPGAKASTVFTVRRGKIVRWQQVPVPAPSNKPPAVTVSPSGPYLIRNNAPFLIMGDSGGSMINITVAQAQAYFADRQRRGFNVVLIHILCASHTSCHSDGTTIDGIKPFTSGTSPADYDLATPNPAYWQRIDDFVNLANRHGIVALLDVLETGSWLTTLQNNGKTKAYNYGVFVGNRYKNKDVIWQFGDDFQSYKTSADANLALQVMQGIHSVDPTHLMTSELDYYVSASLDSSVMAPRITLNAAYTYFPTYAEVLHAFRQSATIPTFMLEANFENANIYQELGTPKTLRQQEYWTALSGGYGGYMYGEHLVHHFAPGWEAHLGDPGAVQFGYETKFFEALPWYSLVPDQNHTVLTAGYGAFSSSGTIRGNDYATAARGSNGSTVVVYAPTRRTMTVDMSKLSGSSVTARWFDPTNNAYSKVAGSPFSNTGSRTFTPVGNNAEGAGDWVLLLTS